jgi:hypothetical protein
MPSLVINDSLDPTLQCPLCARLFVRCELQIAGGSVQCPFCRESFPILEWSVARTLPPCVSVSELGRDNWRIDVSMRSLRPALAVLAACVAPIFGLLHAAMATSAQDDPFARFETLATVGSIVLALALPAAAAYFLWGRYSIAAEGLNGTAFRGVGPFGIRQHFPWQAVNGVCLTTELTDDDVVKRVIRVEGVGFHQSIGGMLTDAQRVYVALFVLRKISETGGAAAATSRISV